MKITKLINLFENSKIVNCNFTSNTKKILLIITLLAFTFAQATLAQTTETVGSEIRNHGFRQVYYVDENGENHFITDDQFTSSDPMREGDYVTYMSKIKGNWQIFLYHIPSETKTQLTVRGNNVNPEIEDGLVVWEGWTTTEGQVIGDQSSGTWQIFLYDGTGVKQLTSGDTSLYPDIEDGYIIMARRDSAGSWRSVLYSINDRTFAQVSITQNAKHPKMVGKKIFHGDLEFPLITDDIYLLGFDKLPATESAPVTKDSILEEINGPDASGSAEVAPPEIPVSNETPIPGDLGSEVGTDEASLSVQPSGQ